MQIHYLIREYSQSIEFPEVHLYANEADARTVMIGEAYEAAANLEGYVCLPGCEGEPLDREAVPADATGLDVEHGDGCFDCFRMGQQQLKTPAEAALGQLLEQVYQLPNLEPLRDAIRDAEEAL